MKKTLFAFGLWLAIFTAACAQTPAGYASFNSNWQFKMSSDTAINAALFQQKTTGFTPVSLPHTAHIEPVIKTAQQWQGTCFYRKFFVLKPGDKGRHIALQFDAAMSLADVYLNGKLLMTHTGGYLPFYVDISNKALFGKENCVLVRLNNQDNPRIPPGKPLKDLDFNFYSGIYRNVWLVKKDQLHISDAVQRNQLNGGGVLLHYDSVSNSLALLNIKTEIQNDAAQPKKVGVEYTLYNAAGAALPTVKAAVTVVKNGGYQSFQQQIKIKNPQVWSPEHPTLYRLKVTVKSDGKIVDSLTLKTGVKSIAINNGELYLSGKKYRLRGTNRHQEYPYIGYALPDNAQYRDAWKIKSAGFNFVRCSHYPPSPAFLDACDELGLFVMDSVPGWQFFGDEEFQKNSLQNVADMIHRDRNHPSVILWEPSLNETDMKRDYMVKAHTLTHAELPYADTYTCGWTDDVYDVFIPARQHAKAPDYWKRYAKDKAILIAEYGDWEYYAQNAGFDQTAYKDLKAEEKTSRQLRTDGEKRMLKQAFNFQESHNDNLNGRIMGDANWLMFDYKRGYAPDIETSGIMDIFRLPKFSYYFYQSQRSTEESKPMLFIASYWNDAKTKSVQIFSNCDEVELFLNDKSIGRQKPDTGSNTNNLQHPPFTFALASFTPGNLKAEGYTGGKKVITENRKTPGAPYKIVLKADTGGRAWAANDAVFVYAYVLDRNDTVVPDFTGEIQFSLTGDADFIGQKTVKAQAGIAPVLVKTGSKKGEISIKASSRGLRPFILVR